MGCFFGLHSCPSSSWLGAGYYASSWTWADRVASLWPPPSPLPPVLQPLTHTGKSTLEALILAMKCLSSNLFARTGCKAVSSLRSWEPKIRCDSVTPWQSPQTLALWVTPLPDQGLTLRPLVRRPCQVFINFLPKRVGHNRFKYVKDFTISTDP